MAGKWRWFTKAARREQFESRMEYQFQHDVKVMSDTELAEVLAHVSARLARTHGRFIYVRQRLEFKVGVMRGEAMRRGLQVDFTPSA